MPMLDPGLIVLSSPLLVSRYTVRRRAVTVNDSGRGKVTTEDIPNIVAVINAQGANGQRRNADSAIGLTTYSVIAKFALRKQAEGILPDIVLYAGMELLVVDVQDYTRYGTGWVQATCTSQRIEDARTGAGPNS